MHMWPALMHWHLNQPDVSFVPSTSHWASTVEQHCGLTSNYQHLTTALIKVWPGAQPAQQTACWSTMKSCVQQRLLVSLLKHMQA